MNNLSIIIVTRNRLDKLKRCLDSLKLKLSEAEIIVVDNGSNDGTVQYLKDNSGIKLIALDSNIGPAGGRNIGVKQCSGEFIVFIDDDAWIEDLNVKKILDYLLSHSEVGIIAPLLFYPNGNLQESVRSFPTLSALFWRGTGLYRVFPNVFWYKKYVKNNASETHSVDWAILACQIIRKELFDKVGLFDEKHFFYEDADFCRRAAKHGYSTVFWPDACIYHEYARTSAKGLNIDLWRHVKSIFRFYKKHI